MRRVEPLRNLVGAYSEWPLPESPYQGYYAFNPSVHWGGDKWRCMVRNMNYLPGRPQVRHGRIHTQNTLHELDPHTHRVAATYDMLEVDGQRRFACTEGGFEDGRLFQTKEFGLCAIATTSQLRDEREQEMAILRLDDRYRITHVIPVRGPWSRQAQKNWTPLDNAERITLVYAIDRNALCVIDARTGSPYAEFTMLHEASAETPTAQARARARIVRASTPKPDLSFGKLRGGSQLIQISNGVWLGVGHDRELVGQAKHYWHRFYLVKDGKKVAESTDWNLGHAGIEFVAGIGYDGITMLMSFGVDDRQAWIAKLELDGVLATMPTIT